MNWLETMFGAPEQKPEPVEDPVRLLEVTRDWFLDPDYYDANDCAPHLPDPSTLQIQRNGQRSPVTHYGPNGWVRFRWVMRKPSEVRHLRADR